MDQNDLRVCSRCLVAFAGRHDPGSIMGTCPECHLHVYLMPFSQLAPDLQRKARITPAAAKLLETEATSS